MGISTVDHRSALNRTIEVFKLVASDLSEASGVAPESISRYRRGKTDFQSETLFRVIRCLPSDARVYYAALVSSDSPSTPQRSMDWMIYAPTVFSSWLWAWMATHGVSPVQSADRLSDLTGLSVEKFSEILSGQRQPSDIELGQIGSVFFAPNGQPHTLEYLASIRDSKEYGRLA